MFGLHCACQILGLHKRSETISSHKAYKESSYTYRALTLCNERYGCSDAISVDHFLIIPDLEYVSRKSEDIHTPSHTSLC